MAYAARLDDNNIVRQVIKLDDVDGIDDATASAFCNRIYKTSGVVWKKTSYNESKDAFIGPQPYASWTLGDDNIWHSPNEPTEWINPDTSNTFPEGEPWRVWSEANQSWTVEDYDTNPPTDSEADFQALTLATYLWNGSVWVKQ